MNLPYHSLVCAPRSLLVIAGVCAAVLIGCGDDDDSKGNDAGMDGGAAGSKAGAGGAGGKKGGAGGKGGASSIPEDDAGVDPDGGEPEPEPEPDPEPLGFRDLSIQMTGFTDEVTQFMQFRLIAPNGEILNMSALHGLPAATFTFDLPDSVPPDQEVELQVWADTAGTVGNAYDAAMDHAWTATIAAAAADEAAVVMLTHGSQSPPPTVGAGDAVGSLGFSMMDSADYLGDLFELRVYENVSGRLVGRQVLPVPGSEVAFEVYGVIKTGTVYRVDFAIDVNGNLSYDEPPDDAAWRRMVTGTGTGYSSGPGATITLAAPPPDTEYVDIGF
jgi:hypothetical protein